MTPDSVKGSGAFIQGSKAGRDIIAANSLTINQTIVQQLHEARRKHWRKLTYRKWGAESSPEAVHKFGMDIRRALEVTFGDTYQDFVALIGCRTTVLHETALDVYDVLCHKASFSNTIQALRRRHIERIELIRASSDPALKEAYRQELLALADSWKSWRIKLQLPIDKGNIMAIRIIYDPAAKEITAEEAQPRSVDPGEYPAHLTRTSELLTWSTQLN